MPQQQVNVPLNDLKRIIVENGDSLIEAAARSIRSGWWLNGRETSAFCNEFADFLGVTNCIGVANGTDALEIAMRAVTDIRTPGRKEVVTVANAGGYTTIATRLSGLDPVYVDIEEASQLVSVDSLMSALSINTALVVVTHLYGGIVDVPLLRKKMDSAGFEWVPILEDCAQAHGVNMNGRTAGSFGDVATFSFYPTKNLGAFGDGGAIVSKHLDVHKRCQELHQYGWSKKYEVVVPNGRNSRLDEVQAAILRVLLPNLNANNDRRVDILNRYVEAAPSHVTVVRSQIGTVAHLAIVLCDDRNALKAHLDKKGIETGIHYPILDCDQPAWSSLPHSVAKGGLPISRRSVNKLLTLPCFPTMLENEIKYVCEAIAEWRQ